MSEAWGTLLVNAPEGALPPIADDDEGYSWDAMVELAGHAGIDSLEGAHPMLDFAVGNELMIEEVPITMFGFIEISIIGEEWIWLASALVNNGQNIELYGAIQHEHNFRELYALGASGIRVCENIDGEDATSDDAANQIMKDWLATVPKDVLQAFPNGFDLDDRDDND